jgi:hypothetical protein
VPHGHVAAAHAMARKLGLPALLGPVGRERDLTLALILLRAVHPGSKLSTIAWWGDVTLGPDLGIEHATTDESYAAVDRLQARQEPIETKLARRPVAPEANPSRMALFHLSSSWLEWKDRSARWGCTATPATGRREKVRPRPGTGCSPIPSADRSRSGSWRQRS